MAGGPSRMGAARGRPRGRGLARGVARDRDGWHGWVRTRPVLFETQVGWLAEYRPHCGTLSGIGSSDET